MIPGEVDRDSVKDGARVGAFLSDGSSGPYGRWAASGNGPGDPFYFFPEGYASEGSGVEQGTLACSATFWFGGFVMVCSRHAIGAGQVARFGSVPNRSPRVLQHARAAEGP